MKQWALAPARAPALPKEERTGGSAPTGAGVGVAPGTGDRGRCRARFARRSEPRLGIPAASAAVCGEANADPDGSSGDERSTQGSRAQPSGIRSGSVRYNTASRAESATSVEGSATYCSKSLASSGVP